MSIVVVVVVVFSRLDDSYFSLVMRLVCFAFLRPPMAVHVCVCVCAYFVLRIQSHLDSGDFSESNTFFNGCYGTRSVSDRITFMQALED